MRTHKIVFATQEQQHSFNFPKQLGTASPDTPADGDYVFVDVQPDDTIITGSDGVWDNLWEHEVLGLLGCPLLAGTKNSPAERAPVETIARMIATAAQRRGADNAFFSPFTEHARRAGMNNCLGGKLDDTTVVLTRVTSAGAR